MAAVIFDFDGTLADSRDYVIDFIRKDASLPPLTTEQHAALHGLSVLAIARKLGYQWWRLPNLFFKGRRRMDKAIHNIETFQGMMQVIKKLHAEGHELFVVSSNSLANIRAFLKRHRLRQFFTEVYGGIQVFGKAPIYRQLLQDHNLLPENVIAIGDEKRDIEAAQSIGLKTIAVCWGFAKSEDLMSLQPTGLAKKPADIIRLLGEI